MASIVPKKAAPKKADDLPNNVRSIRAAGHAGGRRSSVSYDPSTGEEVAPKGYRGANRDSETEFDVFAVVDDRGYREDRFYTRSVNADGHGERMQVRVPQGIDSQMYEAVARVPEYKTVHDLIRDSIIHRLEFLQKRYDLGDGARRMLELERIRAGMEHRNQEIVVMQSAVDDLEAKLQSLYNMEDWDMMIEEFDKGSELLDWLRDPYRSRAAEIMGKWKATTAKQVARRLAEREQE